MNVSAAAWVLPILAAASTLVAQPAPSSYTIRARLDPDRHTVSGHVQIHWTNSASEPIQQVYLHLYLNAFAGPDTSFMREAPALADVLAERNGWGRLELNRVSIAGVSVLDRLTFTQPDDGNPHDTSLAQLELPELVSPGEALALDLDFVAHLPWAARRVGYRDAFHFVGQWYPKLAVLEPVGTRGRPKAGWKARQFHAMTEFYADFADYDVALEVPQGFVVAATGTLIDEQVLEGGMRRLRYQHRRVHDFAFAADPAFVVSERGFRGDRDVSQQLLSSTARMLGRSEAELMPADVSVRLYRRPGREGVEERVFRAAFSALAHFGTWLGPYPFDELVIVEPPRAANDAVGGMEYPGLVTIENHALHPPSAEDPEMLTIHEIAHQWFQGVVANDEVEEPWLDEGLASYWTARVLDEAHRPTGPYVPVAGVPVAAPRFSLGAGPPLLEWTGVVASALAGFAEPPHSALEWAFRRYLAAPDVDPIVVGSWRYRDRGSYFASNYWKPTLMLATLERELGPRVLHQAFRSFADRFRYGHPGTADLIACLEEASGQDVEKALAPLLYGTAVLDHSIGQVSHREVDGRSRTAVELRNRGELPWPVTLRVTFSNGAVRTRKWDGGRRWTVFEFEEPGHPISVDADPAGQLVLDVDPRNNHRSDQASGSPSARLSAMHATWLQGLLTALLMTP